MAGYVGKLVFNRILQETVENNQGRDDPYFETIPAKKMSIIHGKPKMKQRKKALPPGLSEADQQTLIKVKRRAYRLDMALGTFCGMKLGWGSLIGIVPAVGDVADTLLALMVIRTASEVGLPLSVLIHMLLNVIFDFVLGLVPVLGDLADMAFKANTRNAILLENYLRERGKETLRKSGHPPQADPSLDEIDEVEETGAVDSRPQPVHDSSSRSKYTGRKREHDIEAQKGGGGGFSSKHRASGKQSSSKNKNYKNSQSSKGHMRLSSQETGIL